MLNRIQVYNDQNTLMEICQVGAPSAEQPFWVKNITGLGPVKADMVVNPNSGGIGGIVGSSKINHRNIVLTLGMNPYYSEGQNPTNLRQRLNAAFTPGRIVKIKLIDSEIGIYDAFGYVESMDSDIFTKESSAIVSVICEDPYLKATIPVALSGKTETPLVIPQAPPHATGFTVTLTFIGFATSLRLSNGYDPDLVLNNAFSVSFGDKITISTVFGEKRINITSGGVTRNALNTIGEGGLSMTIGNPADRITIRTNRGTDAISTYTLEYSPMLLGF